MGEVELFAPVNLGEGVLRAPDRLDGAVAGPAARGPCDLGVDCRLSPVGEDVEFGDLSVAVLEELFGMVGVEPLLGGDLVGRAVEVDAAGGEFAAGTVGVDPGDGGGGLPAGARVVDDLQLGGALGRVTGFGGRGQELLAFGGVAKGCCPCAPQFGVGVVALGLFVGGGEVVGDPVGGPGLLAVVGGHADAELAVGHLLFVGAAVGEVEGGVRGVPGGVVFGDAGLGRRAERVLVVGVVGEFAAASSRPARPRGRASRVPPRAEAGGDVVEPVTTVVRRHGVPSG
ncbi:hypothetical protein [Pseudonocardia yuanmonensis]|uniref:hypothetical protein n=1 Tax=Pseudonocardia yuanmonensis TaxID=1095914 RepID=UPI0031E7DD57